MSDATFICRCEYIGKDKWKLDLLANAKPILFNTEMVRAILENRKTVTRRVVKPQPLSKLAYACMGYGHGKWGYPGEDAWKYWEDESFRLADELPKDERKCRWTPPCHPGDILYVRETFCAYEKQDIIDGVKYAYKADATPYSERARKDFGYKWRPSIHMPREAARIFLRVTDVRVERLQEITPEQAMKEGVIDPNPARRPYIQYEQVGQIERYARNKVFPQIWNSTIKPADRALYGWDASPWVWVIAFEQISKEDV